MRIKLLRIAFIIIVFSFFKLNSQNACPVNFDGKILKVAKNDIPSWNGKIIACNGEIIEIKNGYQNKPYFKVKLENEGQIWVGSLIISGYEKEGAKLRILGYFTGTENDSLALRFNKDGYHILAFTLIDLTTKKMATAPGAELQVKEWIGGAVPKSK